MEQNHSGRLVTKTRLAPGNCLPVLARILEAKTTGDGCHYVVRRGKELMTKPIRIFPLIVLIAFIVSILAGLLYPRHGPFNACVEVKEDGTMITTEPVEGYCPSAPSKLAGEDR